MLNSSSVAFVKERDLWAIDLKYETVTSVQILNELLLFISR